MKTTFTVAVSPSTKIVVSSPRIPSKEAQARANRLAQIAADCELVPARNRSDKQKRQLRDSFQSLLEIAHANHWSFQRVQNLMLGARESALHNWLTLPQNEGITSPQDLAHKHHAAMKLEVQKEVVTESVVDVQAVPANF